MKKIIGIILTIIIFSLLICSCEPTDWEYILAAPGPVKDFAIVHTTGAGDNITFNFDFPASAANQYQSDSDSLIVWIYYRLYGSSEEIFIDEYPCDLGVPNSINDTITLTASIDYDFIVCVVDEEYQRSEPSVQTVTW